MPAHHWSHLTTTDFSHFDPATTVALLPVAAVEQHGPHLPLATDALINRGIIEACLPRLADGPDVLVLPAIETGSSLEHTSFAGTLDVGAERLLGLWADVGAGVARAGLRKLVIFNTHGGQTALVHLAALRLRAEFGMLVARANYFAFGAPEGLFDPAELRHGLHGGEVETSLMLHLHPQLVRRDGLTDFRGLAEELAGNRWLGVEKPIGIGWLSEDLHPAGVSGSAVRADAARGARYLEFVADCLAGLLAEVATAPLDILSGRRRP